MLVAFGSMATQSFPQITRFIPFLQKLANKGIFCISDLATKLEQLIKNVDVDTVSGATPLAVLAEGGEYKLTDLLFGIHGGAIGETCAIALLIGFIYLLVTRVITWHIPVSFVGFVYIGSLLIEGDPMRALMMTLSGGLLLGAIFMATDYVTSPTTPWGKIVFGFGAALITTLIRYFGVYPEGVSFAILFMNILTPYIDEWTKYKVFGAGGKKA